MKKPRSGTNDEIRRALGICSEWITDNAGNIRKNCPSCPYRNENDPAGMACGERLMRDAKDRIEELEGERK